MKGWRPWLAATVITGTVACGMLAVGVAAAVNPNGVAPSDTPGVAMQVSQSPADAQTQLAQLQGLVQQYQAREAQYQAQLAQAQAAANGYEQVLLALQQSGVIRITADGQILIRGGGGG
jgi:hypothetical protein